MQNLFTKESFQCNRYCGKCCKTLIVRVSKAEIERIKKLGCKEEDFLERDIIYSNKFNLKRDKNGCIFLKQEKDGKYSCGIYQNRPNTCQQYPFFPFFGKNKAVKSCLPHDIFPNVFFKFNSSKK